MKRPQPGPPEDFQPIRNRSLNKEINVRTSREKSFFDWLVSILNFWPSLKTLRVFFTAEMPTLLIFFFNENYFRFGSKKFTCKTKKKEVSLYRKCLRIGKIILVSGRAVMSTRQAFKLRSSAIRYFKPL